MAVKMRPTGSRTKRPRGALLQFGTEMCVATVENRRESRVFIFGSSVEYLSLWCTFLTQADCKRQRGHCLMGSLTGEVAC